MSVRNWNFFYKKEDTSLKEKIVTTISLWIAIYLLWWAFYSILNEYFPQFVQVKLEAEFEPIVSELKNKNAFAGTWEWQWLIPWMLLLFISYDWPEKYLKKWNLVVRGVTLAIPIGYAVSNYEKITEGMIAILEQYYPYVNRYYQTGFFIQGGVAEDIPIAVTFFVMVYWLFCWLLAYGTGKKIGIALFPVLAVSLELAVGLSPVGSGLIMWFLAIFLLLVLGGSGVMTKLWVSAGVIIALLCSKGIFGKQIEHLATIEQKEAVLEWQDEMLRSEFWNISFVDFLFDKEVLRNKAPTYTGKTVLEIMAGEQPHTALYLRGFYGNDYKDSVWSCDNSAFLSVCQNAGKSEQEVAKGLFDLPLDQIGAYYEQLSHILGTLYSGDVMYLTDYEITTAGLFGDSAYVPYASDYESLDEAYTFTGDSLLKKSIWDNKVKVQALYASMDNNLWKSISSAIQTGLYGKNLKFSDEMALSSVSSSVVEIDLEERKEELDWYNELAKQSLDTKENLLFIEEAAKEISQLSVFMDGGDIYLMESGDMDFYTSGNTNQLPNNYRLHMANLVRGYLHGQMSYSLILDELPKDADPIEYALTESHEGYCMHFASAATLLLRELGVPARYVSGYVVMPSDFEETENDYYANVTDYSAHAWVEIYLDYIGWVPIEVTPGYESYSSELPTQKDKETLENVSEERRKELEEEEERESEMKETEEESELQTQDIETETMETEEATDIEDTEDTEQEFGNGNQGTIDIHKFFVPVLVIGFLFGVVVFFQSKIKRRKALLEIYIKEQQTRKAVTCIHQRIGLFLRWYYFWKTKHILLSGKMSDREYEEALTLVFPNVEADDWKNYMQIVQKMYYSLEEISQEEMMHCYQCYSVLFNKRLIGE